MQDYQTDKILTLECALADICKESRDRQARIEHLQNELAEARKTIVENAEFWVQQKAERDLEIKALKIAVKANVREQIDRDPQAFKDIIDDCVMSKIALQDMEIEALLEGSRRYSIGIFERERHIAELMEDINSLLESSRQQIILITDQGRQIQDLQCTISAYQETLKSLRSHFEIALQYLAMMESDK